MIQQLLKQLGFSEKEISVYIAVLQKGKVAPSEVAKITGINRTTVYSVAQELKKRGVISEDLGGSSRYLVALPLQDLSLLVKREEKALAQKKKTINKAIKELSVLAKDAKYTVPKIVFVGEQDIEKHIEKQSPAWTKSVMSRDGIWWGFQDHTFAEHYEKWVDWYWEKIAEKKTKLKFFTNKSVIEKKMQKKHPQREMRFWSDTNKFTATTWIAGDYLVIIITNQRPHYLVEIHDATLAHNMREIFKGLWKRVK